MVGGYKVRKDRRKFGPGQRLKKGTNDGRMKVGNIRKRKVQTPTRKRRQPRGFRADRHRGRSRCRPPEGVLLLTRARVAAFTLRGVRPFRKRGSEGRQGGTSERLQQRGVMADRLRRPRRCRPPLGFLLLTRARGAAFPLRGVGLSHKKGRIGRTTRKAIHKGRVQGGWVQSKSGKKGGKKGTWVGMKTTTKVRWTEGNKEGPEDRTIV